MGTINRKAKIFACVCAAFLLMSGCGGGDGRTEVKEIPAEELSASPYVNWYGRNYSDEGTGSVMFNYSVAGFETCFEGTSLTATFFGATSQEGYGNSFLSVFVDGRENVLELSSGEKEYVLCSGLDPGKHLVKVLKRTELQFTSAGVSSLVTDGHFLPAPDKPALRFEFYGDSIT